MGHRLVSFLESALPQHPEYHRITLTIQRRQCQSHLEWVRRKMEEIALTIDEAQLNAYVDCQYEPAAEESVSSSEDDDDDNGWESFTGWGDHKSVPAMVESDTSSCDWTKETSSESEPESFEDFPDPDVLPDFDDSDDDDSEHSQDHCVHYALNEPVLASSFLKKISLEDVRYETDSEAMDSWAQDDESFAISASSGSALTCDPARIAFRELMNRLPR